MPVLFRVRSFTAFAASLLTFVLLLGLLTAGGALAADRQSAAASLPRVDSSPTPSASFAAAQTVGAQTPSFTDVDQSNAFYPEISWLASTAVSTGYDDHTFRPVVPVNRDAMAAFMYRLAGKPDFTPPAVSPFADINASTQFYKEITWLAAQGISTGWTEPNGTRTYRPVQPVNRDAMAAFMYRFAGRPAYAPPASSGFVDVPAGAQFFNEISWLAGAGISTGYDDHTYRPVIAVNRDAMAAFMYRFVGRAQNVDTAAGTLNVGPAGAGHASALIRLSVPAPTADSVMSVAGAPALAVRAGVAASTTVLVPLTGETTPVSATAPVAVKAELLATFDGAPAVPGSTNVLGEPVTRADTTTGLAGSQLSIDPITVGLTGSGGVPSTGVRSVYATATVQTNQPAVLTLGTQTLTVPAGTSAVTTILSPGDDGNITASLSAGTGALRLDVRGYIPDAGQDANNVNVTGSFVPASNAAPAAVQLTSGVPVPVTVPGLSDRSYSLALITATGSTATGRLAIGTDNSAATRRQGILVDAATGAGPQLALIPENSPPSASLTAGNTTVTVEPVGDILSDASANTGAPATVQVTAPVDGSTVDLSITGTVELTGTINNASVSTKAVTVSTAGAVIGSAAVRQTPAGTSWSYRTGIPQSGTTIFTVTATDRAGTTSTATVTVNAVLPTSTATLTAPETVVLDPAKPGQQPATVTPDQVAFTQAPDIIPGQIIVSAPTAAAPEGILRKVTAVNKTATGWVAETTPAAITDAIHQASIDQTVPLTSIDPTAINTATVAPAPDDTPDVAVAGSGPEVTTATGTSVDLAPLPTAGTTQVLPGAVSPFTTAPNASPNSVGVDNSYSTTLSMAVKFAFDTNGHKTDYSTADGATATATKSAIKASGGVTAEAKSQIGIGIHFRLMISMHVSWGIPSVKVDDFSMILTTNAKTAITADAYLQVQATDEIKKTIASVHLPTLTFAVGPVPVVIANTATITFNTKLTAQTSIHVETSVQRTQNYGFRYSTDTGLRNATTAPVTTLSNPLFGPDSGAAITGKIDASMGPTIDLTSKIYDMAGPVFTIGAKVGATGEATLAPAGPLFKITAFLEGAISVGVRLTAPVIDKVLLDTTLINLSARWSLAAWTVDYATQFPNLPLPQTPAPSPSPSPTPSPVGTLPPPSTLIRTGTYSTYAVRADGTVWAWGDNSSGQLGNGSTTSSSIPVKVSGLSGITDLAVTNNQAFAIASDGTVWAWGNNAYGQLGNGTTTNSALPVQVKGLNGVTMVKSAGPSTYALRSDGTVWAWGDNSGGQLGNGTTTNSALPVRVSGLPTINAIAGTNSMSALGADGTVWTWGYGRGTPAQTANLNGIVRITDAGAVKSDGTAWSINNTGAATQLAGLTNVRDLIQGNGANYALEQDGTVWGWGYNGTGAFGNGTSTDSTTPVEATGLSGVAKLVAVNGSAYAIKADETVWVWGANLSGQLGTGDNTSNLLTPVNVPSLNGTVAVTTAVYAAFAVKTDGSILGWGEGAKGQLGHGSTTSTTTPTPVNLPTVG